jgi:hypothetical protein
MPKDQGAHQPNLASINKSTIIQLKWLSHVTQLINQITAKMNNQTYVVKGILFLYHAPKNLCLTTVIKEGAWGHIPLHLPSHSLPLVI